MKGMKEMRGCQEIPANGQNDRTPSQEERNRCIEQYLPLVRKTAGYVIRNNAHRIEYEDLVNIGILGLIQALKKYDSAYDVSFAGFCKTRIRGAMLDELRRLDWVPRLRRKQFKEIEDANQEFQLRFNRRPGSKEELAAAVDIPNPTLAACKNVSHPVKMLSLNELVGNHTQDSESFDFIADPRCERPDAKITQKEMLHEFTTGLTRTEQLVLTLYYQEGLNLHQTGLLLGFSESRACQIHSEIIVQLRRKHQKANRMRRPGRSAC